MTCEACEAETQMRLIARGKQSATPGIHHPPHSGVRIGRELHIIPGITVQYGRMALNANYLNLQPLCGCVYWGDCRSPHVADCASLIVNMGLLRLQPLRGCASGIANTPYGIRLPEMIMRYPGTSNPNICHGYIKKYPLHPAEDLLSAV